MKKQFILSAVGANITGIVAQVSREIYAAGCNFEDSSMTFLGKHFSLMILVTGEKESTYEDLKNRCETLRRENDLSVSIFRLVEGTETEGSAPVPNYEIRVKGQDRMGIVYRTSQLLASLRINIVNMETAVDSFEHKDEDGSQPVFTMRTAVVVPETVNREMLRKELEALSEDIYDTVSFTPIPAAPRQAAPQKGEKK
ncbi:MAG: ACT domain-containing protein [Thermodesulfobacteriota bacterium]|nr:ACT domain-containing protein [Thermodesulfobacteriota bacterium]